MRWFDIINEGRILSDFKIGFELEAVIEKSLIPFEYKKYFDNPMTHDQYEEFYKYEDNAGKHIGEFINQFWPDIEVKIKEDSSIEPSSTQYGFEWPSPAFNFTPGFIKTASTFLSSLHDAGISTNQTCGFHIHLSFPYMEPNDMIWIMCCLSENPEMIEGLKTFNGFTFHNEKYANSKFFKSLKTVLDKKNWEAANSLLTSEKFRLVRLHPQGTLEWRGPRNFLIRQNYDLIKRFFLKIYEFVKWINHCASLQTYNDLDRKTILSNINDNRFILDYTDDKNWKNIEKLIKSGRIDDIAAKLPLSNLADIVKRDPGFLYNCSQIPPDKAEWLMMNDYCIPSKFWVYNNKTRDYILNQDYRLWDKFYSDFKEVPEKNQIQYLKHLINLYKSKSYMFDNYFSKVSYDVIKELIVWNPRIIQFIDNPSEELQLMAINKKPELFRYLNSPTKRVAKLYKEKKGKL